MAWRSKRSPSLAKMLIRPSPKFPIRSEPAAGLQLPGAIARITELPCGGLDLAELRIEDIDSAGAEVGREQPVAVLRGGDGEPGAQVAQSASDAAPRCGPGLAARWAAGRQKPHTRPASPTRHSSPAFKAAFGLTPGRHVRLCAGQRR